MTPIQQISSSVAKGLSGVLFDLDDTFLDGSKLSEFAYRSLFRLRETDLRLIAVTGRPASWAELCVRMWPIEAAIAENGAFAYRATAGRVELVDFTSPDVRKARRAALWELASKASAKFPELVPTDDIQGRISDYTFDIGEHEKVPEETIVEARQFARKAGARTTRSSVHLHYTFDRTDKATGVLRYLRDAGEDPTAARKTFAFIGDSENDAACFAAFDSTVGVRNLRGHFSIPPRYITQEPRSAGFVEFANILCQLRKS